MKQLHDHFGNPVDVGDILLGARGRNHHYKDTVFDFSVVIGRTKGMLRVHKLGEFTKDINLSKQDILDRVETRRGRKGGIAAATNFVRIKTTGITQDEFTKALELGSKIQPHNTSSITSIFP